MSDHEDEVVVDVPIQGDEPRPPLTRGKTPSLAMMKNIEYSQRPEIHIVWENLRFSRDLLIGDYPWNKQQITNNILKGVSGSVKPGEMLAIMGPTGCGKTSLLNLLSYRARANSGKITINGENLSKKHKRLSAYVLQQDTFLSVLTVRETLRHTARMRLPSQLTREEKYQVVEDVIASMNLEKAANTIVGSAFPFVRGISGGEKKRLNIANEILTNPGIIFVDEPTSGLDSATSYVVVNLLKDLARRGCTVITTIHQPSSQIFALFDRLMLMADGNVVYEGLATDAVSYFAEVTEPCPSNYNPADYLLELLVEKVDEEGKPLKGKLIEEFNKRHGISSDANANADGDDRSESEASDSDEIDYGDNYASSWMEQFRVLYWRSFKMKFDRMYSYLAVFQCIATIFTCCVVWFNRNMLTSSLNDRNGLLYFAVLYYNVNPMMGTILQFGSDRQVHEKERANATYRLSAFFVSRVISDMPIEWVFPFFYSCIVYWTSNLNDDVWRFFLFMLILFFMTVNGVATGLFFACVYLDMQTAIVYALCYFLLVMLLGGFFVQGLQVWVKWCRYLSAVYYGFNLALIDQYEDEDYCFLNVSVPLKKTYVCGPDILDNLNVEVWWGQVIGIVGLTVMFLILAYLALRFLNRPM